MADPFQTYLYREGRALYVNPLSKLAPRLNLLDVLIQKESEGWLPRRPVLCRVGSMLDLGTSSSKAAQDNLRESRDRFWKGLGSTDELFFWSNHKVPAFEGILASKSSMMSSLVASSADVRQKFSGSCEFKLEMRALDTACVNCEVLGDMIASKPPKWQPDLQHWSLHRSPSMFGERNTVLWVVYDILYARTLVVKADSSHSIDGTVSINIVPELSASNVEVTHSRERRESLELEGATEAATHSLPASRVPNKVMVGFRLKGFVFNSSGDCVRYYLDPGPEMPVHRAGPGAELSHSDQRAQIRCLYVKAAPEYDSDEDEEDEEEDSEGDDADDIANDDGATKTSPEDLERWPIVEIDGEVEVLLDEVYI